MKRRKFLKSTFLAGIGTITSRNLNAAAKFTQDIDNKHDVIAIHGGESDAMFRRAITELGGIKNFIKRGETVCIKPDIGWNKSSEYAANTNPKLIAEIIKQCFEAGAKEVIVFDHTSDDWRKCYVNSGIEKAVKSAGAKMVSAHLEKYYKDVPLPNGKILKNAKIHQAIVDADKWINVPVLKNHGRLQVSIAMKNYMGIVWNRNALHFNDIDQCIADICSYHKKPILNVVDAYRVMKTRGPRGLSEDDVVLTKRLFVSQDIVAVDTIAKNFLYQIKGLSAEELSYISKAYDMGIGNAQLNELSIKEISI